MDFVALLSGGKDSIFNTMECVAHGYQLKAVVHLSPPTCDQLTGCAVEADSYMYQTVASEGVQLIAQALSVPLYQVPITGKVMCHSLVYQHSTDEEIWDEVEDLHRVLSRVKADIPSVGYVASGAILSNYQRTRVENVVSRLGMTSLAFLWQRNQGELLSDMITASLDAIIVKIAAFGLDVEKDLGCRLAKAVPRLLLLSRPPLELNICGEGGEYESFTLNCPLFHKSIDLKEAPIRVLHSNHDDSTNPIAYLQLVKTELLDKPYELVCCTASDLLACKWLPPDVPRPMKPPLICPLKRLDTLETDVYLEINTDIQFGSSRCSEQCLVSFDQTSYPSSSLWLTPNQVATVEISSDVFSNESSARAAQKATELVIQQLSSVLRTKKLTSLHILHCILLIDNPITPDLYAAVNSAYAAEFGLAWERTNEKPNGRILPPSRVCLAVEHGRLIEGDMLKQSISVSLSALVHCQIQLTPSFYQPNSGPSFEGLHIRSLSHWAPANIGPYSQVITVPAFGEPTNSETRSSTCRAYLAGQIGLVPETMDLPSGDLNQCWLALRHCHRIMKTVSLGTWKHLSTGICYATSLETLAAARKQFHDCVCTSLEELRIPGEGDTSEPTLPVNCCSTCSRRVVWALVSDLPKQAIVEWHLCMNTTCSTSFESTPPLRFLYANEVLPFMDKSTCTTLVLYCPDLIMPHQSKREWLSFVGEQCSVMPVQGFLSAGDGGLCTSEIVAALVQM